MGAAPSRAGFRSCFVIAGPCFLSLDWAVFVQENTLHLTVIKQRGKTDIGFFKQKTLSFMMKTMEKAADCSDIAIYY